MSMQPEQFERLLSDALDAPQDEELRRQVEQAALADAGLARLRDEWTRAMELARAASAAPPAVDWRRFRARVVDAITAAENEADDAVVRKSRAATGAEARVNWPRLRERIARAATAPRVIRFPLRWLGAAGLVGAAAAVMFLLQRGPIDQPVGRNVAQPAEWARVSVTPVVARRVDAPQAYARARISHMQPPEPAPAAQPPELFLMIDPAPPGGGVVVN